MASLHAASSDDGLAHRFFKWFSGFSEIWYVKHFVLPLIYSFPPALTLLFISKDSLKSGLPGAVQDFLNENLVLIVIFVLVYPVLLKGAGEFVRVKAKPRRAISVKDMVALSSALEEAAAVKLTNAVTAANKQGVGKGRSDAVLSLLVKPQEQYERLTAATYDFFATIDPNSSYRVGLMRVEGGQLAGWLSYSPPGRVPRMDHRALSAPASCVSRCVAAKTIVVVGDVVKEAGKKKQEDRRFVSGVAGKEPGSQICAPVLNRQTGTVDLVLCVAANGAGVFDEGAVRVYEQLLAPIISRLQYERCLEGLSLGGVRDAKAA